MVQEEALAPFASWGNARADYGAVGDGVADDTAALQRALDTIGHPGSAQVLFLPPGTYRIRSTLRLIGSPEFGPKAFGWGGVGIIGADPATVRIKWDGPAGEPMLVQNGGIGTRYNRITWDGSGTAGIGVAHWWNTKGGGLYGAGFEHQDEVFRDMAIGIMAGRLGSEYGELDSEGQVRRVTFINISYAGLDTGSFNALDWWIWDSHFIHCARGVSNEYSLDESGVTRGAGAMYVYRSLFEGSTVADFSVANTGWFSMHNDVSIGSRRFLQALRIGPHAANVILENNRVVDSKDPVPISLGNTGPLLLVDNQIQAGRAAYELTDWVPGRDVLSLGNRLTADPPTASVLDRLVSIDDVRVPPDNISRMAMTLPATPPISTHEVFEVPIGAKVDQIQALIDGSARSRDPLPIVHFSHATWTIDKPLKIQSGAHVQLVGDGYGSLLEWAGNTAGPMLQINGAARVTIRNMQWIGPTATAVNVNAADQPGGRIQLVASRIGPLQASHLRQTSLSLQADPAVASISLKASTNVVAMGNGVIGPISLTDDSSLLTADSWYEGTDTALFRMSSGRFTYLGGHMAPATHPGALDVTQPAVLLDGFRGAASWIGMRFDLKAIPSGIGVRIDREEPDTHAYFIGMSSYVREYFRRSSGSRGSGTVAYRLNRGAALGRVDLQTPDQGDMSVDAVRDAWRQARSLTWDSEPYEVPAGSIDIRLYHVKMDQTGGLDLRGLDRPN